VILVTSASAGEGKTVSSVNLAATLAEAGSRVLLIDVDLHHPGCHRALGVENTRGLSSFLAGQTEIGDVMRTFDSPRLSFVPAGPTPPNPAELIGSVRMREAMDTSRVQFDFVILDSPPVTPVSDALVLGRWCDGVVLVVKGQDTPKSLVRRARDQLQMTGTHLLGAVVNNVGPAWGDFQFYQRYYGYYQRRPEIDEEPA
jgi:capsular exopolysaccharide synthesis family protein